MQRSYEHNLNIILIILMKFARINLMVIYLIISYIYLLFIIILLYSLKL